MRPGAASTIAILTALASVTPAAAQGVAPSPGARDRADARPSSAATDVEEVVVTGSFIQGTPEDAALPVEVFSSEELEKQGAPTALEFAKTLAISGPTLGESNFFTGSQNIGSVRFNLRGIGSDKTLTLLNGRRMSQNTAAMPSAAIARVEVLKDGAAVIYGADATGGVVNFITRTRFEGLEGNAQYKYINGSKGDYSLSLLGGVGAAGLNFLWSGEWEHRSRLQTEDRTFSSLPYELTAGGTSTTEIMSWQPLRARPTSPGANGFDPNTYQGEFGANAGSTRYADATRASCEAIGGLFIASNSNCGATIAPFYNLVEDQDIYRAYAQVNGDITENAAFHAEVAFGEVKAVSFAAGSRALTVGPARQIGGTFQFYVPRSSPFFADFAQRSGLAATAAYQNGTVQGLSSPFAWRPFVHAGSNYIEGAEGYGTPTSVDTQVWRVSSGLNGRLGDLFGPLRDVRYDLGVTYNNQNFFFIDPGMIVSRLQEALNGFGGPDCHAQDLNPLQFGTQNDAAAGKNGCLWFNPFASSFARNPELGLTNPVYVPGFENSPALTRWLFDERALEQVTQDLTVDLVFNSKTPLRLPGGDVAVAAGAQVRQVEFRQSVPSNLANGNTPCIWTGWTTGVNINGVPTPVQDAPRNTTDPLFTGCTPDAPGPFRDAPTPPQYFDRQQYSYFGELQLPLLDNVALQAAVRREEFSGGLGATVYKVAGRWNVFGPLTFRGSYGTNYQTPPISLIPGDIDNTSRSFPVTVGYRVAQTITAADVQPETAKTWNVGAIWESRGLADDHSLRVIVDYFNIETSDEIGPLAGVDQITSAVFSGPRAANGLPTIANCNHPLIGRIVLNDTPTAPGGKCLAGVTNGDDLAIAQTVLGNGPGQSTAGVDFQITYALPVAGGDLTVDVSGTRVTKLLTGPTFLDGVQVSAGEDRLGFVRSGAAPRWRVNGGVTWDYQNQSVRLGVNYISNVRDATGSRTLFTSPGATTTWALNSGEWINFQLTYIVDLPHDLRIRATLDNIMDRDPPRAFSPYGYDTAMGSPLGRTFELSVKKKF